MSHRFSNWKTHILCSLAAAEVMLLMHYQKLLRIYIEKTSMTCKKSHCFHSETLQPFQHSLTFIIHLSK